MNLFFILNYAIMIHSFSCFNTCQFKRYYRVTWGKRTQARKSQERIMSWVIQTSLYHTQSIYATPNKIELNCAQCRELKIKGLGEANLWRIQSKTQQRVGGSGFPKAIGTTLWSPLVVTVSSTTSLSIVLLITRTAPSVVLTLSFRGTIIPS